MQEKMHFLNKNEIYLKIEKNQTNSSSKDLIENDG